MSFNNLVNEVISLADSADTGVDVVQGLRTEDLPTPCISVHLESATSFNNMMTDVFIISIVIRYEEHHADSTSEEVASNFKKLLDVFVTDDVAKKLDQSVVKVFNAKVEDVSTSVENEYFVNDLRIQLIAERDV